MDLVQQLSDIVAMQRFDYIVIEASGICEPAPIAQTISAYPQMYPEYAKKGICRLDSIVTVVDAVRLVKEFDSGNELKRKDLGEDDLASLVIQQVEFCNIIIINKASDVTPDELKHLKAIVKELQPKAEILTCDYGDIDLDKILNTHLFDFEKVATSAKWIAAMTEEDDLENEESGEALEYGIETFVYQRRAPFDLGMFDEFVSTKMPHNIIRAKGICYFRDEMDTCYIFEQAGTQIKLSNGGQWYATMPKQELQQLLDREPGLRRDWDEKYGDRMEKLVFIGQKLDKEQIISDLDKCLAE